MNDKNTILICDDERDVCELAKKILVYGGFDAITCSNGKEALQIIEEKYDTIALILLDVMMPILSGFSVLENIKNDGRYKNILVILFTVKSLSENIRKARELHADGYLTKPFSAKGLLKFVKEKLHIV